MKETSEAMLWGQEAFAAFIANDSTLTEVTATHLKTINAVENEMKKAIDRL